LNSKLVEKPRGIRLCGHEQASGLDLQLVEFEEFPDNRLG
jgi:hypothetical protein